MAMGKHPVTTMDPAPLIVTDKTMTTNGLYQLMSWMSPSYPVGAYTYSHGIEYAVEAGLIKDRAQLTAWLKDVIEFGAGRTDTILLAEAYRAAQNKDEALLFEIAELGFACCPTKELALETTAQGRAFVTITDEVFPSASLSALKDTWKGSVIYPVAVAAIAADRGVGLEETLVAYLHGFVSNLVSAAVRIIPLGQTDGQRTIAALEEAAARQVQTALFSTLDDIGTATLMVDWCSAQHETQYTRLFRS